MILKMGTPGGYPLRTSVFLNPQVSPTWQGGGPPKNGHDESNSLSYPLVIPHGFTAKPLL